MNDNRSPEFFQIAFVCTDLEKALPHFSAAPGESFVTIDVAALGGAEDAPIRRIALGYLGPTNIEVIEVRPDVDSIFRSALRADGEPVFHHVGYLVDDRADWDRLVGAIAEEGGPADSGDVEGFLSYLYVDRRDETGHFAEYVRLGEGGRRLFDSIPRALLGLPGPI